MKAKISLCILCRTPFLNHKLKRMTAISIPCGQITVPGLNKVSRTCLEKKVIYFRGGSHLKAKTTEFFNIWTIDALLCLVKQTQVLNGKDYGLSSIQLLYCFSKLVQPSVTVCVAYQGHSLTCLPLNSYLYIRHVSLLLLVASLFLKVGHTV